MQVKSHGHRQAIGGVEVAAPQPQYLIQACACGDGKCRRFKIGVVNPKAIPVPGRSGEVAQVVYLHVSEIPSLIKKLKSIAAEKGLAIE